MSAATGVDRGLRATAAVGDGVLHEDPELREALLAEAERQRNTLSLVASSSVVDESVLAAGASSIVNVTAEGYPGRRFHAGCRNVDTVERLAIDRAKAAFGATYANVQPHSASLANQIVMFGALAPGDTILGMDLASGGHLTHGARASVSGRWFDAIGYGVGAGGLIDYDEVRALAIRHRPRMIICGATAYPRTIDFSAFGAIADEVGALLLADVTHTAGLIATGLNPSPIDFAHVTTMCTHKQLYGPRGGLILSGRRSVEPLRSGRCVPELVDAAVFPLTQGAPFPDAIAAKARALMRVTEPDFAALAARIVDCARGLASALAARGYTVVSGGTDNHIVLVDLTDRGISGAIAERALERCDIVVNRNTVPGERRPARIASGIRIGTNTAAFRGIDAAAADEVAGLVDQVLSAVRPRDDVDYELDAAVAASVAAGVHELCREFPLRAAASGAGDVRE